MRHNKICKTSPLAVRETSKTAKVSYKNIKWVSSIQSLYLPWCFSLSLFTFSFSGLFFFKLFFIIFFFSLFYFVARSINAMAFLSPIVRLFIFASQKIPQYFTKTAMAQSKISLHEPKICRTEGWNFGMLYRALSLKKTTTCMTTYDHYIFFGHLTLLRKHIY